MVIRQEAAENVDRGVRPVTDPRVPSFSLLSSLESAAEGHPLSRKILVAPTFGEGSELLRAFSLRTGGWIGYEVTTPRRLAGQLVGPGMTEEGLSPLDEFDQRALIDESMDLVLDEGSFEALAALTHGVGFREVVERAVSALRSSGVPSAMLPAGDARRRFLRRLLEHFEAGLEGSRRLDASGLMVRAADLLNADGPVELIDEAVLLLLPGLSLRGAGGRFVRALQERGGVTLAADPVVGLAIPPAILWRSAPAKSRLSFVHATAEKIPEVGAELDIEIFAAASVRDELREVLRRVMRSRLTWDDVEIVTPDPTAYGAAFDALSRQLRVPASFGVGLSIERTRPGRAIAGYLRWIEGGFAAENLRTLLEAGDIALPGEHEGVSSIGLARRLRSLRIGWGRTRYLPAIRADLSRARLDGAAIGDDMAAEAVTRSERRVRELEALEGLVERLDGGIPEIPEDHSSRVPGVSTSELARGVRLFLELVPRGEGADAVGLEDLLARLGRIVDSLERKTSFDAALAVLRKGLDIRVRAAWNEGSPPWKSTGGHIHLTDVAHGGYTGRRAIFLVGLDSGRFPGSMGQDPLLTDSARAVLQTDLPTSHNFVAEKRFKFAALLARLRGTVTASYAAWEAASARVLQPSPILLDLFRLGTGRSQATFTDLNESVGPPVCSVPRGSGMVDGSDVWLDALTDGGVPLDGNLVLEESFPEYAQGLAARRGREADVASPYVGLVEPRPALLDPRESHAIIVSATRLEALGACPLRYLLRYGIGLRPPGDPELDPERWLDPLQRGALLHRVFELLLSRARDQEMDAEYPGYVQMAMGILAQEVAHLRDVLPVPNESVFRHTHDLLQDDVRSFAEAVREMGAPWVRLEMKFGRDEAAPVELELDEGSILIQGAVDRVDRTSEGLRVIDYKTGSTFAFSSATGVFSGGRRMQHLIYSEAIEQLLGEDVAEIVYLFPTTTGRNEIRRYDRESTRPGLPLLSEMLNQVGAGRFLPTDDADDCRVCDFKSVCRVSEAEWEATSPMAEWGRRNIDSVAEYAGLKKIRAWEKER